FGAEPTLAFASKERGNRFVDAAGAQDRGAAHVDEDAAGGVARIATLEGERTQLVGGPAVVTHTNLRSYFSNHCNSAFCACMRLPACWKTTLRSPSSASLVTSSPRWAGGQ